MLAAFLRDAWCNFVNRFSNAQTHTKTNTAKRFHLNLLSVPCCKRRIFSRCAKMIKAAIRVAAKSVGQKLSTELISPCCSQIRSGIVEAATIEPSETYRVANTISRKTIPEAPKASGASTRKTPTPVATPLPPRNPNQTGNIWPMTTKTAAAATQRALESEAALEKTGMPRIDRANNTAAVPLQASSNNVKTPAPLPARRETFVAPVPPDPVSLMSAPESARTIR